MSVQQLSSSSSSSACFWFTDSASAALAVQQQSAQQQSARQLLKCWDVVTYAYGACASVDTADNQEARLGHRPVEMIRQGVYEVGCRIQRSRCITPTAIEAAEAAAEAADAAAVYFLQPLYFSKISLV
jgi:hypothetical protein